MSSSGFTLTTATGEQVTVEEASSTTYRKGTSPASASAIATGEPVLVLGTTDNTTITATQVIVQPPSTSGSNPGGQVIGFSQGAKGSSEQAGQIPADYKQGSGTIVSGTAANKATEAALAAYPGGIVDRVVQLSDGEYEVHYIGVNWPHHICRQPRTSRSSAPTILAATVKPPLTSFGHEPPAGDGHGRYPRCGMAPPIGSRDLVIFAGEPGRAKTLSTMLPWPIC